MKRSAMPIVFRQQGRKIFQLKGHEMVNRMKRLVSESNDFDLI